MRRREVWLASAFALGFMLFAPWARAQGGGKDGTVSGTVTIDGKPTADAVVAVEGVSVTRAPQHPYYRRAVMSQRDLRFYPYILPVMAGAKVDFVNDDKVWHDVYSSADNKKFDLDLYAPGKTKSVVFDKPGVVRIQCNVHPTMEAYIVVEDSPYFAATDRQGNFHIAVPPGTYRLVVWSPTMGTRSEPFTIEHADEVLRLDVDLSETK